MLERYPSNGKLRKVYGRFLEFVKNDPWTAAKYYDEATKQGTTESLLSMTAGQNGAEGLAAAGSIDEKVDGLVIINAQVMQLSAKPLHVHKLLLPQLQPSAQHTVNGCVASLMCPSGRVLS